MINFDNFFKATYADWVRCEIPDRNPDYLSYSGSVYWDLGDKVRRLSDHWGLVKTCFWTLDGQRHNIFDCGEMFYEDFRKMIFHYEEKKEK